MSHGIKSSLRQISKLSNSKRESMDIRRGRILVDSPKFQQNALPDVRLITAPPHFFAFIAFAFVRLPCAPPALATILRKRASAASVNLYFFRMYPIVAFSILS